MSLIAIYGTMLRGSGSVIEPEPPPFVITNSKIVADGNSYCEGNGYQPFTYYMSIDPYYATSTFRNFGVGSQLMTDMLADQATQILPEYVPGVSNALIVVEGGNEVGWHGVTEAIAKHKQYCLQGRAQGFRPIMTTCIKRNQDGSGSAAFNAAMVEFNNQVIADPSWYDGLIRPDLEPMFATYTSGGYDADQIHPNALGQQKYAELFTRVIRALTGEVVVPPPPFPMAGLVAHWNFEEASGGPYYDSIAGWSLAQYNGAVTVPGGKINQGVHLASASTQFLIGSAGLAAGAAGFTIAGWFKFDAPDTDYPVIMTKGKGGTATFEFNLYYGVPDNVLAFSAVPSSGGTAVGCYIPYTPDGNWVFIVAKWDGANITISINNGTPSYPAALPTFYNAGGEYFFVGNQPGGGYAWGGIMDLLGIWNRGLTAAEITALYNSGAGLKP